VTKRFTALINPIIEVSLQREAKRGQTEFHASRGEKHQKKNKTQKP
jgi:hypothetical protein